MGYYWGLCLAYARLGIKQTLAHRADFWIGFVSTAIYQGVTLAFISVIFGMVGQLQGWAYYETILIYGFLTTSRFLSVTFLNMPWGVHGYIRSGALDTLLVRPTGVLFQMIGISCVNPSAVGHLAVGTSAIVVALSKLGLTFRLWWIPYIGLALASGALVFFSLHLLVASVGFWAINVRSLMYPVSWLCDFAQYPVTIYPVPIQFLLTWVLPYAMAGFYPAVFLMRGDEYRFHGLIAPLSGFVLLGIALGVWQSAIKRYQSTGS